MVLCEVCNTSYHGNKKECPVCNDKNAVLQEELNKKEEKIQELSKSLQEPRRDMDVMLELAKTLQATLTGMQSFMKDMLQETQRMKEDAAPKTSTPIIPDPRVERDNQDGCRHCGCGGKNGVPHDKPSKGSRKPSQPHNIHLNDLEDLWDDRDDDGVQVSEFLHRVERRKSRFDIVRFLPENERKKTVPIDCIENLIFCLNALIDDVSDKGVDSPRGIRRHLSYLTSMSKQGIYDIRALVSYDAAVREKADKEGIEVFDSVDTAINNLYLGYGGTKHARQLSTTQSVQSNNAPRNKGGSSAKGKRQPFTGWKKVSAEKGCCFSFGAGKVCEGCAFKHSCAYCDATTHGLLKCKQGEGQASAGN